MRRTRRLDLFAAVLLALCGCTTTDQQIKPPETPANCGWGDDGKTLYMTARTGLYRIKLAAAGMKTLYQ